MVQTAERISHAEASDNVIFQRSLFAYYQTAGLVNGTVLEIGTGMGYGISIIKPLATRYIALDKFLSEKVKKAVDEGSVEFFACKVPPLENIPDESVDFVFTFQVIEHIKNDHYFLQEINRVLKKGGKLILTTPNIKMSLTRNPWHIREYTYQGLQAMLEKTFTDVSMMGVYGNDKVNAYYEKNKASVNRITRFDIFNLQYLLPRFILQIPYDILNRMNRNKLLQQNQEETLGITHLDYRLEKADDKCFDLFAVAVK